MFTRQKNWISGAIWKPKNPHSLEHLKFLYGMLGKNQTVTEQNRSLLVETLRSISEILIWGDQNDSSVFDFFLEKNMLSFFLRYIRQKYGRYICVQLLQTLNILFENIRNETSLYYLLSNNHINSIIVHKFDFSDEEVMAYYISFLKTLSLKLNRHTIHFFYNEHTNDFALYTEAIKFFNHSESMVRIAVRTITLNVYKGVSNQSNSSVDDKAMLRYIRDRTAAPYFSNLVWFIGNHILTVDLCVRHDSDHRSRDRLSALVAEHLDHLHYLNDILNINIDALNEVITDHLLNRLLIPLYVYSLTKRKRLSAAEARGERKHVSSVVSLFLLSQVWLIIQYPSLVQPLAEVIFQGEIELSSETDIATGASGTDSPKLKVREFKEPAESLEKTLANTHRTYTENQIKTPPPTAEGNSQFFGERQESATTQDQTEEVTSPISEAASADNDDIASPNQNSTDEEKLSHRMTYIPADPPPRFSLENRPYLEAIFNNLECSENDYAALFALCLLYAITQSEGVSQDVLDKVMMPTDKSNDKTYYNIALVERLLRIITIAAQSSSKVRLATLEVSIKLLKQLVYKDGKSYLQDRHLASLENAKECSTQRLRNFYKSEEIFLDMFEDEYRDMKNSPLNVEYLMMDASILLSPTGTPLTGIDFNKRLPCGEVERARRAIRVFFLLRDLSFTLLNESDVSLPLTKDEACVKINDVLDLNNSDLIACTILLKDSRRQERRFLVIDPLQLILVEPDTKRLGWGVVRFVGFLQDIEVTGDKDDSRSLQIVVHKPSTSKTIHSRSLSLLTGRFIFDDHIRCMAAKQRLIKGRIRARQQKMSTIERLLDISSQGDGGSGSYSRSGPIPGRSHPVRVTSEVQTSASTDASVPAASKSAQQCQSVPEKKKKESKTKQRSKESNTENVHSSMGDSIEVAQEATSAFAVQTLNHDSIKTSSFNRHSPKLSAAIKPDVQEIPMEDLSGNSKHRSGSLDRPSLRLQTNIHKQYTRSHSHSPRRHKSDSDPTPLKQHDSRQPSAQTKKNQKKAQTSLIINRPHSHSSPIPMTSARAKSHSSSEDSLDSHKGSRSFLSQSPKSLRPADAPTLSLVSQPEMEVIVPSGTILSPKLIPPADEERIRSFSDVSTGSSDSASSSHVNVSTQDMKEQPVKKGKGKKKLVATADSEKEQNPSQELTLLAQMVQEHYKFPDTPEDEKLPFPNQQDI
ncbi:hypothetical protein SNE40_005737 [Patella caerulea]|uniref:Protein CLEC16A n=1 Tax=Patella caerulea TaxID=87958 RepID=A0AAN8K239_PATCE